jgi:hypothetical protein
MAAIVTCAALRSRGPRQRRRSEGRKACQGKTKKLTTKKMKKMTTPTRIYAIISIRIISAARPKVACKALEEAASPTILKLGCR